MSMHDTKVEYRNQIKPKAEGRMKKNRIICSLITCVVLTAASAQAASISRLGWPSDTHSGSLTFGNNWNYNTSCTDKQWLHTGIDLSAPASSKVYAAADGVVRVSQDSNTSWKEWITIEHTDTKGKKYTTTYWHLNKRKVNVGDTVKKGAIIAEVASMSRTHLHFGVRNASYDNTANRGGLPNKACTGYPAYQESFVNPKLYLPLP